MRLILAPMEGVLEPHLRALLCTVGGFDLCIGAFIRVVDTKLPSRVFLRHYPELHDGAQIASIPLRVQLLGQDPKAMAQNALHAIKLGSPGIDLNFGCPAKTVNKSQGGAYLLQYPEQIGDIVSEVRAIVPSHLPVSVKIRLGWDNPDQGVHIAETIQQAGASELYVHGRTRNDGYRADRIDWEKIGTIKRQLQIPVIANGEIWSADDAQSCKQITRCEDLMLGRGVLHLPNLAHVIRGKAAFTWSQTAELLLRYSLEMATQQPRYMPNRCKQWLNYLRQHYLEAAQLFHRVRALREPREILDAIEHSWQHNPGGNGRDLT